MRHLSPPSPSSAFRVSRLVAVGAAGALALSAAPASAALPDGFAGISTEDAYVGSDAYQAKELGRQRTTGFTVARQVFKWDELEPGPGVYEWSATDRFVTAAAKAKIRIIPLIYGEPSWATSRPAGNTDRVAYPPADVQAYGRFAEAVAKRYGAGGTFWAANPGINQLPATSFQLWNEPNLSMYWGGAPNARQYSQLMIAGSAGLHRGTANPYVISAGIPESKAGSGTAAGPFIKTMLENGGVGAIDAVGVHPSGATAGSLVGAVKKVRTTVDKAAPKAGSKKLALWVTEFGWAVGGPKAKGKTVSASVQSDNIKGTFRGLAKQRKSWNIKGAIYFSWRDSPVYPGISDFWGLHTGLVDLNGKDRRSLKDLAKALPAIK